MKQTISAQAAKALRQFAKAQETLRLAMEECQHAMEVFAEAQDEDDV